MKYTPKKWRNTPYAESKAGDPDQALTSLLGKYGVMVHQISQMVGPNGRPAIVLRFQLKQSFYRIAYEVLDAPEVEIRARIKQVKRAIYWMLKSRLEEAGLFAPLEESMCGWLELPDNKTIYEASAPYIQRLPSPHYAKKVFGLLPPKEEA